LAKAGVVAADYAKVLQERRHLQALLDSHHRTGESSMEQKDMQIQKELAGAVGDLDLILGDLEKNNRESFDLLAFRLRESVTELEKKLDSEFANREKHFASFLTDELGRVESESAKSKDLANAESSFQSKFAKLEAESQRLDRPRYSAAHDTISIDELHNKIRALPELAIAERAQVLDRWTKQLDAEELRHRDAVFALLPAPRPAVAIDPEKKALIAGLTEEIELLGRELHGLEFIGPMVAVAGEAPDEDQQKLRDELQRLRQERRQRTREAEAQALAAKQELEAQIEAAKVEMKAELEALEVELEQAGKADRAEYEKQRQRRKDLAQLAVNAEEETAKFCAEQLNERSLAAQQTVRDLDQLHADLETQIVADREELAKTVSNARLTLKTAFSTLIKDCEIDLHEFERRAQLSDSELANRVVALSQARDNARDVFFKKPRRAEEHSTIQRLERHLSVKTQQLTTVGKDLVMYRQQLALQEGEYNGRFGVDPKVAIMRAVIPKRRPTTTFVPRRLPRLSDPV
jgi:hypothetical protein